MARPGFTNHRKFKRLASIIGSKAAALGHMEFLWSVAYEAGDPFLGDSLDVELAAEWDGDEGEFASAVVECGLVDRTDRGYEIHDLWDHAPDYVAKRRSRELQRKESGGKLRGAADADQETADTDRSLTAENGKTADTDRRTAPNGDTPTPTPAPLKRDIGNSTKRNRQTTAQLPDESWLADIAAKFPWVDITAEMAKAQAWVDLHPGRRLTRQFFLRWIGKVERPIGQTPAKTDEEKYRGMTPEEIKIRKGVEAVQL